MRTFVASTGRTKSFDKNFPHGTRARYVQGCTDGYKGRACLPCTEANRVWTAERARLHKLGIPADNVVSAAKARQHLKELRAAGMGRRQIAQLAHVSQTVIQDVAAGRKTGIRRSTETAILALRLDVAPGALVDASRTWKLLDEMIALGFPKTWIASQILRRSAKALQLRKDRVTRRSANRVAALHDRLQMQGLLNADAARLIRQANNPSSRDRVRQEILEGALARVARI